MKLSESIQSKIDKQRSVGHHSAAIVDYDLLNEWVYEAKQIEQKLLQHSVMQAACQHEIVDARNEVISSGFMCVKCNAIFKAASVGREREETQE